MSTCSTATSSRSMARLALSAELPFPAYPPCSSASCSTSTSPVVYFVLSLRLREHCVRLLAAGEVHPLSSTQRNFLSRHAASEASSGPTTGRFASQASSSRSVARCITTTTTTTTLSAQVPRSSGSTGVAVPKVWPLPLADELDTTQAVAHDPHDDLPPTISLEEVQELLQLLNTNTRDVSYALDDLLHDTELYVPPPPPPVPVRSSVLDSFHCVCFFLHCSSMSSFLPPPSPPPPSPPLFYLLHLSSLRPPPFFHFLPHLFFLLLSFACSPVCVPFVCVADGLFWCCFLTQDPERQKNFQRLVNEYVGGLWVALSPLLASVCVSVFVSLWVCGCVCGWVSVCLSVCLSVCVCVFLWPHIEYLRCLRDFAGESQVCCHGEIGGSHEEGSRVLGSLTVPRSGQSAEDRRACYDHHGHSGHMCVVGVQPGVRSTWGTCVCCCLGCLRVGVSVEPDPY
jgi:hypothetical protein